MAICVDISIVSTYNHITCTIIKDKMDQFPGLYLGRVSIVLRTLLANCPAQVRLGAGKISARTVNRLNKLVKIQTHDMTPPTAYQKKVAFLSVYL